MKQGFDSMHKVLNDAGFDTNKINKEFMKPKLNKFSTIQLQKNSLEDRRTQLIQRTVNRRESKLKFINNNLTRHLKTLNGVIVPKERATIYNPESRQFEMVKS